VFLTSLATSDISHVSDCTADPSNPHPQDYFDVQGTDPDFLIAAFQELDLSAEALIYSTKTIREDTWTLAIMAALGEKVELYDKVSEY